MSKRPNILPTRTSFFISSVRKIERVGIQKLYGHIYTAVFNVQATL